MAGYLHTVDIRQVVFQKATGKTASMLRSKKLERGLRRLFISGVLVAALLCVLYYFADGNMQFFWFFGSIPLLIYLLYFIQIVREPLPLVRYGTIIEYDIAHSNSDKSDHPIHLIKIRLDDTGELIHELSIREPFQKRGLEGMQVVLCQSRMEHEILPAYGLNTPVWSPAPVPAASAAVNGGYEVTLPEMLLEQVPSDLRNALRIRMVLEHLVSGFLALFVVCPFTITVCMLFDDYFTYHLDHLAMTIVSAAIVTLIVTFLTVIPIPFRWPLGVPVTILQRDRGLNGDVITFRVNDTGQIVSHQNIKRSYCRGNIIGTTVVFVQLKRGRYCICPIQGKLSL